MKIIAPERGSDKWGSGAFGASRGDRIHKGIDYACYKGSLVLSPVTGECTKIGFPYADPKKGNYRYVQITDSEGREHRIFYIEPQVRRGDWVETGDVLGESQGIADHYPGMTDHVHYEILVNGKPVNPNG